MSAHSNAIPTYIKVYLALMVLLVATVAVAYVHLGPLATPVAMLIATVKALLVAWFFMHLNDSSVMVRFAAASGLVGLWLAFLLIFMDYVTRY